MTEIIDIHPHIVSQDTDRYPVAPLLGKRSDWSHDHSIDFAQLVAAMDAAGVAKAAIVHSSTTYGFDDSYVADSVAQMPDRFTGVFSVDVFAEDAPDRIAYWHGRGLSGLRIFSKGSTIEKQWLSLDDPRLHPVFDRAVDLGLSVCINVGASAEELTQVHTLLTTYPGLRVVLDHLGRVKVADGPPYEAARPLLELARHPNMYLKLTPRLAQDCSAAGSKGTTGTFLPMVVRAFGAERIAFGSNYPASPGTLPELVSNMVATLGCLGSDEQEQILSGTAKALYPVLAQTVPA